MPILPIFLSLCPADDLANHFESPGTQHHLACSLPNDAPFLKSFRARNNNDLGHIPTCNGVKFKMAPGGFAFGHCHLSSLLAGRKLLGGRESNLFIC